MGKIPGVPHLRAVKALQRAGFQIIRQGKHIVMSDGIGIVRDAGLTEEEFRRLL